MEIENNSIYVIKIDNKLFKVKGRDIILSLNESKHDCVVMYDKDTNLDDVKEAIRIIKY